MLRSEVADRVTDWIEKDLKMAKGKTYKVVFEREDGWWTVSVPSVRGCHTQGKNLDQARLRIREALDLWVDDADSAVFDEDIRLPNYVQIALDGLCEANEDLEKSMETAVKRSTKAAKVMVLQANYSLADAGVLMDLTRQRVQQIVAEPEAVYGAGPKVAKKRKAAKTRKTIRRKVAKKATSRRKVSRRKK